jgi:hypothetical protein
MNGHEPPASHIILSSAAFPSVSYLKAIVLAEHTTIEQFENYIRQSFRNRYVIYAANGLLSLSIPVILATNKKTRIKDVRIDYDTNWQKQHYKSIESAYRSSPFFEFLIDDFQTFFSENHKFLFDYNLKVLDLVFNILDIDKKIDLTTDFENISTCKTDLRSAIHPKKESIYKDQLKTYPQVFSDRFGFKADLSCLDLLFNLGIEAYSYLIDKY